MTGESLCGHVVVVDFDGVLHSYVSGWTGEVPADPPEPGAREFVAWLAARGARVVVVSTRARSRRGQRAIRRWLAQYGFPDLEVTYRKVPATAYVDDRAVPCAPDEGWEQCKTRIAHLTRIREVSGTSGRT